MDIPAFRTNFPEFASAVTYPTSQISLWASLAEAQVLIDQWGTQQQLGVQLYVAHEITLAAQNAKAASVGDTPGSQGGIANSKSVGSVSVSYDSANTSEKNAGYWNLTTYGKQFYRLCRIFGAGAIQL